ncbi:MAG: hypothetical protein K2X67_10110 [Burkholderiales bacterium]|nr:hypothetical protein [Burkholderiales bacterium]
MIANSHRRVFVAAAALMLAGCTGVIQRYSTPETRINTLRNGDLKSGGLAFLTPSTVTGQEEDRQTLALLFTEALAKERPDLRLIPLPEVLSAVNRAHLIDDYQHMYADYRLTGVFNRAILHQVAEATGARYLAQLKLARFEQGAKSRFGIFGLNVSQTQYAIMRMFLQIWDSEDGSVAWEGIDELSYSFETTRESTVTMRMAAQEAARDLGPRLP